MADRSNTSAPNASNAGAAAPDDILDELRRIRSSEMFTSASRLGDLLDYVIEQNLSDPSRKILAKTIAEEVYGRSPDPESDGHNIVRVDAGRLRRRLAEYYAGPGQDDPVIIHIDPGGYVPRYEFNRPDKPDLEKPSANDSPDRQSRTGVYSILGAALIVLAVGFGLGAFVSPVSKTSEIPVPREEHSGDPKLEAERLARLAKSPSSLQAVTLSDHARNLIFPMFERQQLELSLAMFRQAISKDPSYFGGYAGAAQCLAGMSVFLREGPQRAALLSEARQMIDRAENLSPANSWTQSALSWVLFVEGDVAQAKTHAEIARDLAPQDGNVLDFYAIVMLSAGELEDARSASEGARPRTSGLGRYANLSLNGAANFHLGNYQDAIDSLNAATASGDPISAPTLAYLAASHQALGQTREARRYVLDLAKNWPSFHPANTFRHLYANQDQTIKLTNALADAGWVVKP